MSTDDTHLSDEIAAYDALREKLELDHGGKWALVHGGELIDTFDTFERAATFAVEKYGRGPYLIRQVGAAPPSIPMALAMQRFEPISAKP